MQITCPECGELTDIKKMCHCGAIIPASLYEKAKKAEDGFHNLPEVFIELNRNNSGTIGDISQAENLHARVKDLLLRLEDFQSWNQPDFDRLKADTDTLYSAITHAKQEEKAREAQREMEKIWREAQQEAEKEGRRKASEREAVKKAEAKHIRKSVVRVVSVVIGAASGAVSGVIIGAIFCSSSTDGHVGAIILHSFLSGGYVGEVIGSFDNIGGVVHEGEVISFFGIIGVVIGVVSGAIGVGGIGIGAIIGAVGGVVFFILEQGVGVIVMVIGAVIFAVIGAVSATISGMVRRLGRD